MSSVRVTTNFRDNNGTDLGDKLVTKDYLISVYPEIGDKIGIPPELWGWGINSGRLGTNDTIARSTPVTTFAGGTNWKQVSAFSNVHTAAIKTDGTLWTWGSGNSGGLGNGATTGNISTPVTTFAGGTNWKQVSIGYNHTAAIKTDGTLWTWGAGTGGRLGNAVAIGNRSTPITTFAGGTNWKQVSSGNSHTSAIKTDGTLWTWGSGGSGQLGNAVTTGNISTPVTTFAGGNNWKQVSSGNSHTSAIKTDGTLWTWGSGGSGQLGDNAATTRSTPVTTFAGGTNWKQVSSGNTFTAAIKTDGTLWTWGRGTYGQLGRLSIGINKLTPVTTFAGGTNWADTATTQPEDLYTLSSGFAHTAAIKTDGTLWTWGSGLNGRLGNGITTGNISTPVTTFAGGNNWKQVSSGDRHTAAVKTDGTLWTWGYGNSGRLGTNATTNRSTPVTTFAGGTNWKQVSSGGYYTAAIKTDGTLWTWGRGTYGALGNNSITNRLTPVTTFAGETNWKQVSAGSFHTAAIKTDGTLWTWGRGNYGQLGTNDLTTRSTPVTTFAGGTNWKQVSCSRSNTAVIKTDGTLWTWGRGGYGALGNNAATNRSTPVTTFAGGTNWKQVSAGNFHTAAVKTDGTLWTWGFGNTGQLGTNDLTTRSTPVTTFAGGTNWKQVSVGDTHTAVVKTDGVNQELYVFGNNTNSQLGENYSSQDFFPNQTFAGGTNWKQVSSGFNHTAAIKTDGTLWTWGNGANGRLGTNDLTTRSTPVTTFAGGTNWKQVSGGTQHTIAIKSVDF
jgi:alpha-tubulin suppressor-like RCC1 family protein